MSLTALVCTAQLKTLQLFSGQFTSKKCKPGNQKNLYIELGRGNELHTWLFKQNSSTETTFAPPTSNRDFK